MSSRIARPIASPKLTGTRCRFGGTGRECCQQSTNHQGNPAPVYILPRSAVAAPWDAKVGGWHRWAGDQSGGWSIPSDASVESGLAASKLIGLTHSLLLNFDGEFVPALPLFSMLK